MRAKSSLDTREKEKVSWQGCEASPVSKIKKSTALRKEIQF